MAPLLSSEYSRTSCLAIHPELLVSSVNDCALFLFQLVTLALVIGLLLVSFTYTFIYQNMLRVAVPLVQYFSVKLVLVRLMVPSDPLM